eukprot:3934729-Heterocapsa_arctica.AAC.1
MVAKGDVKTALLPIGVDKARPDLLCEPVQELREFLHLADDEAVRLLKSAYGLVNARSQWWKRIRSDLAKAGWEEIETESCSWVRRRLNREILALAC